MFHNLTISRHTVPLEPKELTATLNHMSYRRARFESSPDDFSLFPARKSEIRVQSLRDSR